MQIPSCNMYYLWCSRCHRQNSDSQRSAAGRRLLLEDGVLLHMSEGEIWAGSRWAACRDIWMTFFFFSFFFLPTCISICGWRKKNSWIPSHPLVMDTLTIPTECLFTSHFLTWRMFFRLLSRSFAGYDTWGVNLLHRVVHFSSFLPCKMLRTLSWPFQEDVIECGRCWWSGERGRRGRWAGRNSHWNKVCVYSGGGKTENGVEAGQWAAQLGSSVRWREHNYDMYPPICRSHPAG